MEPITLTNAAKERVKVLLSNRDKPALGVRISLKAKGCSGLSYAIEYADQEALHDEVVKFDNVNVFIDPQAILHILGTEMDYVEDIMQSGFVFNNPNEKGRCGCGKSFHV